MNDGILPSVGHRSQSMVYADPNMHKSWQAKMITDYWKSGGEREFAEKQARGVGDGFIDEFETGSRAAWSVASSDYPSTAATSRPRTTAVPIASETQITGGRQLSINDQVREYACARPSTRLSHKLGLVLVQYGLDDGRG